MLLFFLNLFYNLNANLSIVLFELGLGTKGLEEGELSKEQGIRISIFFIVEHLKEKVYCFVEGKVVPKLQTEAELQKEKLGTGPEGQGHAETGFFEKIYP